MASEANKIVEQLYKYKQGVTRVQLYYNACKSELTQHKGHVTSSMKNSYLISVMIQLGLYIVYIV